VEAFLNALHRLGYRHSPLNGNSFRFLKEEKGADLRQAEKELMPLVWLYEERTDRVPKIKFDLDGNKVFFSFKHSGEEKKQAEIELNSWLKKMSSN